MGLAHARLLLISAWSVWPKGSGTLAVEGTCSCHVCAHGTPIDAFATGITPTLIIKATERAAFLRQWSGSARFAVSYLRRRPDPYANRHP